MVAAIRRRFNGREARLLELPIPVNSNHLRCCVERLLIAIRNDQRKQIDAVTCHVIPHITSPAVGRPASGSFRSDRADGFGFAFVSPLLQVEQPEDF